MNLSLYSTNMLEVGKLYSCSKYYLMFYPDKDAAVTASGRVVAAPEEVISVTGFWSRELGKPVSHCNPETPLLVLRVKDKYVEVLVGERRGWIIFKDWLGIEEIE